MKRKIDIQEAFDGLTKAHYELLTAFHTTMSYLLGYVTADDLEAKAEIASGLEAQARLVGLRRKELAPHDTDEPNVHMMVLADTMRGAAEGNRSPFQVVPKD